MRGTDVVYRTLLQLCPSVWNPNKQRSLKYNPADHRFYGLLCWSERVTRRTREGRTFQHRLMCTKVWSYITVDSGKLSVVNIPNCTNIYFILFIQREMRSTIESKPRTCCGCVVPRPTTAACWSTKKQHHEQFFKIKLYFRTFGSLQHTVFGALLLNFSKSASDNTNNPVSTDPFKVNHLKTHTKFRLICTAIDKLHLLWYLMQHDKQTISNDKGRAWTGREQRPNM